MLSENISIEVRNEIEELKNKFAEVLKPLKVYLFGSYADGTFTKDSDFDFYIIVDNDWKKLSEQTLLAYEVTDDIKKHPLDILVGNKEKYELRKNTPFTIENEVNHKGVPLYG